VPSPVITYPTGEQFVSDISTQRSNSVASFQRFQNAKAASQRIARKAALATAVHTTSKAVTAFEHATTVPSTEKQTTVLQEQMEQAALSTQAFERFKATKAGE
jgi:hypothetical protein